MEQVTLRRLQFIAIVCAPWILVLGQPSPSTSGEQTHFSAEDSVSKPIAIPPAIRKLLANDENVKELAKSEDIPSENFPDSWFSASAIHLSSSPLTDVVLVGRGPMLGANITQFWVFCATSEGYRVVLQAGAHDLFITRKIWHHYRQIDLESATGTAVYNVSLRFDGHAYKAFRNLRQPTQ